MTRYQSDPSDLTIPTIARKDTPSLFRISREYGKDMSEKWLYAQIINFAAMVGIKDKISGQQAYDCAKALAAEYGHLAVSHWQLFFRQLKAGKWGEFYGSIDSTKIGAKASQFCAWLREQLDAEDRRIQQEKRDREYEESLRTAVTREQYELMKSLEDDGISNSTQVQNSNQEFSAEA